MHILVCILLFFDEEIANFSVLHNSIWLHPLIGSLTSTLTFQSFELIPKLKRMGLHLPKRNILAIASQKMMLLSLVIWFKYGGSWIYI